MDSELFSILKEIIKSNLYNTNKIISSEITSLSNVNFNKMLEIELSNFLKYIEPSYIKKVQNNTVLGVSGLKNWANIPLKIVKLNEFKNELINYSFAYTYYGLAIFASTTKGLSFLAFCDNEQIAVLIMKEHFHNCEYRYKIDEHHEKALRILYGSYNNKEELHLHIKGTDFQFNVWQKLLQIPFARLTTYGQISQAINKQKAQRAVGTAIGRNPIAYIIPCHRVLPSTGKIGGYMWEPYRKAIMIAHEANLFHK